MPDAIVETTHGKLRGSVIDGIYTFKGVPYGASTAGAGRWQAPQPPQSWSGLRDALEFGDTSPQIRPSHSVLKDIFPTIMGKQSEDCLNLNIWTPGLGDGRRRPVMLYIHGGGFHYGSSFMHPGQEGDRLARRGDVVSISVNHRLGALGYLSLGGFDERFADSANVGMLDLILALQWVRDNAETFGGDPGNVTIFGQSGGGAKVSTLLAMPEAEGLFHRAIIMSGARLRSVEPDAATSAAKRVLDEVGVAPNNLDPLLDLSHEQVAEALAASAKRAAEVGAGGGGLGPTIDGRHLLRSPFYPDATPVSKNVPIMVGSTHDELTYQLLAQPDFVGLDEAGLRRKLLAQLKSRPDRFQGITEAQVEQLIEVYRGQNPDASPADLLVLTASDTTRLASIRLAERRSAQAGAAPVYMYFFTWRSPALDGALGATHTIDIPFVFDQADTCPDYTGRGLPGHDELVSRVSDAWINFARAGSPGHAGLPSWPAYDSASRATMVFDAECKLQNDPLSAERQAWSDLI